MLSLTPRRPRPSPSREAQAQGLALIPPTDAQALGAMSEGGFTAATQRRAARSQYDPTDQGFARTFRAFGGQIDQDFPLESPVIDPADLNKRLPAPPGHDPFFTEPIPESLAQEIHRQKIDEIRREGILTRFAGSRSLPTRFALGMVGFSLDPAQAATMLVPGVWEAKTAAMLGRVGLGARAARLGGVAVGGATAGAAAEGLLAAAQLGITSNDVDALSLRDAITRVFYGGATNALFNVGLAGAPMAVRMVRGQPEPVPPTARVAEGGRTETEAAGVRPAKPVVSKSTVRPVKVITEAPAAEATAGGAALAEPAAGVTAPRPFQGDLIKESEFRERVNAADQALPPEAAAAITDFVGHEAGKVDSAGLNFSTAFGFMREGPLEQAVANNSPVLTQIEQVFAPIREELRSRVGDTITLYRSQRDIPADAKPRNVLSWTSNRAFAENLEGAKRDYKIDTEERIAALEKELAETDTANISPTKRIVKEANEFILYDDNVGGMVTDVDSVRSYLEGENEYRAEFNAKNAAARNRVVSKEVPLEDVVWITDRAGQSEFIVRNQGAAQLGPMPKMSAAQTQRATVSAVASVLADEPVAVVGPRPATPQSTLDALEELANARVQQPDPNLEAVSGITKAAQAEAAARPAPERGEARSEGGVAPVKETIQTQLTEIGVDPAQAEASATIFDAFFRTMAARVGKTADELYRESGLTFEKVTTAEGDFYQPAWHSSPHVFEQFSTDKMGTGEGAQMFGWGLYFSQKKGLYDHLRKAVSKELVIEGVAIAPEDRRWLNPIFSTVIKHGPGTTQTISVQNTLGFIEDELTLFKNSTRPDRVDVLSSLERIRTAIEKSGQAELRVTQPLGGRTFEVDLPDDNDLLLWDRPLAEQPEHVRQAIEKLWAVIPGFDRGKLIGDDELTGQLVYEGAVQDLEALQYSGELGEIQRIWEEEFGVGKQAVEVSGDSIQQDTIALVEEFAPKLRERYGAAPTSSQVLTLFQEQSELHSSFNSALSDRLDAAIENLLSSKSVGISLGAGGRPFRADEFVSRFLLREGIEGHKYLDRGSRAAGEGTYNFVIYSGDKVRIRNFYQDARGAIKFGEGKALISLFENSDPSTIIHEAGHFILETFIRLAKTEPKLAADLAILQRQFDFTDTPSVKSHEDFASSWETYLRTGKAPSEELKSVFKLFKEWITEVYQRIKGKLPAINPEIRKLFDRMLAEPRSFGTPFGKPPARLSDYTFKTSKGTSYEVRGSRTFRPDPRGDQLSDQTIYISPEDAKILRPLKLAKGTVSKLELRPDGKWGLKWIQGEKAGTWDEAISIGAKDEPAEGLVPVGLTKDGTYANIGTQIVEINKPLKADPEMDALQRAVEELNLPPEELQAIMRDLEDYGTAQRAIPAAMTQAQQCLIEGGMF